MMNRIAAKGTSKFLSSQRQTLSTVRTRSMLSSHSALLALSRRTYSQSASVMTKTVKITYIEADGTEKVVDAEIGKNLMNVAHDHQVDLEGACGGELACSTCHLIFEPDMFATLPEKQEEEDDMLDLAFEVTPTSRLGCQILVREDMEGMTVRIPDDGF